MYAVYFGMVDYNDSTRSKAQPDCSPPGYPSRRLLIVINVKKTKQFKHGVRSKPNHTSKTAKIILKLSVCVFLNILLKTVILNYSTMASNTDVVKKTIL